MRITPLYKRDNSLYKNQVNPVSFGSIKRNLTLDNRLCRNDTYFFRDDIRWKILADEIAKGKKPKTIYCYACSDGSESYSIAIALITKLGYEKAKEYFPIVAKDIDDYIIKKAQSGYIELGTADIIRMNESVGNSPYSFFRKTEYPSASEGNIVYEVDDKLKKCVCFTKGNFIKDAASLNYSDAVIVFRNVWPYLTPKQQDSIMRILSKKMQDSTLFVTGSFDHNCIQNPGFNHRLSRFGLHQTNLFMYKKCNLANPVNLGRAIVSNTGLCLMKLQDRIANMLNLPDFS